MCIDIALGMSWLHHRVKPIVHFDLKPANILVMNDYTCKITDFGLSVISKKKNSREARGTMLYMPPETLRRKWYYKIGHTVQADALPEISPDFLPKIDVYSYSLILWEICTQTEVFSNYSDVSIFCSHVCDKDLRPEIDNSVPPVLTRIITHCWSKDPTQRPSFIDIVPQLEYARIKYYLDPYDSEVVFWQKYFPNTAKVPFPLFVDKLVSHQAKLSNTMKRTCDYYNKLNKIIGNNNSDVESIVSLDSYRQLITWFGPLFTGNNFHTFSDILKASWFFPFKSGQDAESIMNRVDPGRFLVRLTPVTNPDRKSIPFTIDYLVNGKQVHHRVTRINEIYHIQYLQKLYNKGSLNELIDALMMEQNLVFQEPASDTAPIRAYENNNVQNTGDKK